MSIKCPRCLSMNRKAAHYCARCGLSLEAGLDGKPVAGRVSHPQPLPPPATAVAVRDAVNLYYRTESAWGGDLWGTEGVGVLVFNGGYDLRDAVLALTGRDASGKPQFTLEKTISDLRRGHEGRVEIASYELAAPVREISVALVSAEFGPEA